MSLRSAQWAYDNAEPAEDKQVFYDREGCAYTVVEVGIDTITLRDQQNQEITIDLDKFHNEYEGE